MEPQMWLGLIVCGVVFIAAISIIIYAIALVGNVRIAIGIILLVFCASVLIVMITLWWVSETKILAGYKLFS